VIDMPAFEFMRPQKSNDQTKTVNSLFNSVTDLMMQLDYILLNLDSLNAPTLAGATSINFDTAKYEAVTDDLGNYVYDDLGQLVLAEV
jgi:hypothetical protein